MVFLSPSQRFSSPILNCRNQRQERSCESRGDSAGAGTLTMLGTGLLGPRGTCAPPFRRSPKFLSSSLSLFSLAVCPEAEASGVFFCGDQSYSQLFFYIGTQSTVRRTAAIFDEFRWCAIRPTITPARRNSGHVRLQRLRIAQRAIIVQWKARCSGYVENRIGW